MSNSFTDGNIAEIDSLSRRAQLDWLTHISRGLLMVLIAILGSVAWCAFINLTDPLLFANGISPARLPILLWGQIFFAALLLVGVVLITKKEAGLPISRRCRIFLASARVAGVAPLLAGICAVGPAEIMAPWRFDRISLGWTSLDWSIGLIGAAVGLSTIGTAPLAVLLGYRLREIARRLDISYLAGHCLVVGIGWAIALCYFARLLSTLMRCWALGRGDPWIEPGSTGYSATVAAAGTTLLIIWSAFILARLTFRALSEARPLGKAQVREGLDQFARESAQPISGDDRCQHCGYDLRATPSERLCPECGSPAGASRSTTLMLRHTPARWWVRSAWGIWIICLSLVLAGVWLPAVQPICRLFRWWWIDYQVCWQLGNLLLGVAFLFGVYLITRRQGYAPTDHRNRWLRRGLRIAAIVPVLAVVAEIFVRLYENTAPYSATFSTTLPMLPVVLATLGSAPVPLTLFFYLRRLVLHARPRRGTADLMLVGIGWAAVLFGVGIFVIYVALTSDAGFVWTWWDYELLQFLTEVVDRPLMIAACIFYPCVLFVLVRASIGFLRTARMLRAEEQPISVTELRREWLLRLAVGSISVLASGIVAAFGALLTLQTGFQITPTILSLLTIASIAFALGVFLLTRAERFLPADRTTRALQLGLRIAGITQLIGAILGVLYMSVPWSHSVPVYVGPTGISITRQVDPQRIPALGWGAIILATLGIASAARMLFIYLRRLAAGAGIDPLAEESTVARASAPLSLIYLAGYAAVMGLPHVSEPGTEVTLISLLLSKFTLILASTASAFILWSFYVLFRFTYSFIAAAQETRLAQSADDDAKENPSAKGIA